MIGCNVHIGCNVIIDCNVVIGILVVTECTVVQRKKIDVVFNPIDYGVVLVVLLHSCGIEINTLGIINVIHYVCH